MTNKIIESCAEACDYAAGGYLNTFHNTQVAKAVLTRFFEEIEKDDSRIRTKMVHGMGWKLLDVSQILSDVITALRDEVLGD